MALQLNNKEVFITLHFLLVMMPWPVDESLEFKNPKIEVFETDWHHYRPFLNDDEPVMILAFVGAYLA